MIRNCFSGSLAQGLRLGWVELFHLVNKVQQLPSTKSQSVAYWFMKLCSFILEKSVVFLMLLFHQWYEHFVFTDTYSKLLNTTVESCIVLEPVKGFNVRSKVECTIACTNQQPICEGFVYLPVNKLCKLVGTGGKSISPCLGDIYRKCF